MDNLIKQLAQSRLTATQAKSTLDNMITQVKESSEYRVALEQFEAAKEMESTLTEQIHEEANRRFDIYGQKHPHSAVEVKEVTTVSYDKDGDDLRDWCLSSLPGVLKVDLRSLDKAAKAGVVSISTVEKEPKVYIKQDLSRWL